MDIQGQGWGLDGAVLFGGATALIIAKSLFDEPGEATDRLAVWSLAAVFFARIGCLNRGCCFGLPTDSVIGLENPPGSPAANYGLFDGNALSLATSVKTWPTQAFEGIGAILIFLVGAAFLGRGRPGALTFALPLFLGMMRLLNAEYRAPDVTATIDPRWVTLSVVVISALALTKRASSD